VAIVQVIVCGVAEKVLQTLPEVPPPVTAGMTCTTVGAVPPLAGVVPDLSVPYCAKAVLDNRIASRSRFFIS